MNQQALEDFLFHLTKNFICVQGDDPIRVGIEVNHNIGYYAGYCHAMKWPVNSDFITKLNNLTDESNRGIEFA